MLNDTPTADLEAEIARRKNEQEDAARPRPLVQPELSRLERYLAEGIEAVASHKRLPKDFDNFVYELAMEAFYGRDIWKWWNSTGNLL